MWEMRGVSVLLDEGGGLGGKAVDGVWREMESERKGGGGV